MSGFGLGPRLSRAEAQRRLAAAFAAAGLQNAALDARLVLCAALGLAHADLLRDPHRPIGAAAPGVAELARRRAAGEPMSRILGRREFWGLSFKISPAVLDPRPETETLVEAVVAAFANRRDAALRLLDLGTGSGAILGALLSHFPNAFGIGVDLSEAACRVARRNLESLGLASRAGIVCGDWAETFRGGFDVIVTNPPYIATPDLAALAPEVRDHDPRLALDGGTDGLGAYRALLRGLVGLAKPDGFFAFEVGFGQACEVVALIESSGLGVAATHRDLAGHARAVTARCAT